MSQPEQPDPDIFDEQDFDPDPDPDTDDYDEAARDDHLIDAYEQWLADNS